MFGFSFLNPFILLGTLAAAIPIALHLLGKRQRQPYVFSDLRFLQKTLEQSRSRSRVSELLLLVLRTLALICFSLALARPQWSASDVPTDTTASGQHVVFLLDNSVSSLRTQDGRTQLTLAKERLRRQAEQLLAGTTFSVYALFGDQGGPLYDGLAGSPDDWQELTALQASALWSGSQAMLDQRSMQALADRGPAVFHYFGDGGKEALDRLAAFTEARTHPWIFHLTQAEQENPFRVMDIQLIPAVGIVDSPLKILAEVAAEPGANLDGREANLYVDGQLLSTHVLQRSDASKGHLWFASFDWQPDKPGDAAITVAIEGDDFPWDNARCRVVRTFDECPVLVARSENNQSMSPLTLLLEPGRLVPNAPKSPFRVAETALDKLSSGTLAQTTLAQSTLAQSRILVIESLKPPFDAIHSLLEEFVAGGGLVVVFMDDALDSVAVNNTFAGPNQRFGGLFPVEFSNLASTSEGDFPLVLYQEADFDPAKSLLSGRRRVQFPLAQYWAGTLRPDGQALLTLADGKPLVAWKSSGEGGVLLCSTSADLRASGLLTWPGALPMFHRLLLEKALARTTAPTIATEALAEDLGVAGMGLAGLQVRRELLPSRMAGSISDETWSSLGIGFYAVPESASGEAGGLMARNLLDAESNSEALSISAISGIFPRASISTSESEVAGTTTSVFSRPERLLLWMTLLLLVIETFVANPLRGFLRLIRKDLDSGDSPGTAASTNQI